MSVVMAVLLAVTMFDTSSLSPLVAEAAPEEPAVEAPIDDTAATETEEPTESDSTEPDASVTEEGEEATPEETEETAKPKLSELQGIALDQSALETLAPDGLIPLDEVTPAFEEGTESLEDIIIPALNVWGAPLAASTGYLVSDQPLHVALTLDEEALNRGFIGGTAAADRFNFTIELPYVYKASEDGTLGVTASAEEWMVRAALAQAYDETADNATTEEIQSAAAALIETMDPTQATRAVLRSSDIPQGWKLWQRHGSGWLPLTADDLAAGISGKVLFRYEGLGLGDSAADKALQESTDEADIALRDAVVPGALDATSQLPEFELTVVGSLDEGHSIPVVWGYEGHSYTNKEGEVTLGAARRAAVESIPLAAGEFDGQAELSVEALAAPKGWSVHALTVAIPEDAPRAQALNVAALYPEHLALRDDARFYDVTALEAEALVELDFTDTAAMEEAGATPVDASVVATGSISAALEEAGAIEPGETRTLVVAVPWAEGAFASLLPATDDASAQAPEKTLVTDEQWADVFAVQRPLYGGVLQNKATSEETQSVQVPVVFEAEPIFAQEDDTIALRLREEVNADVTDAPASKDEPEAEEPSDAEEGDESTTEEDPADGNTEATEEPATEIAPRPEPVKNYGMYANALVERPLYRAAGAYNLADHFNPYLFPATTLMELPETENVYMVSKSTDVKVQTMIEVNSSGGFIGDLTHPIELKIVVPFIYKDAQGNVLTADTEEAYKEAMGITGNLTPEQCNTMMRLAATPQDTDAAAFFEEWRVYVCPNGTTEGMYQFDPEWMDPNSPLASPLYAGKGLTGTFILQYIGAGGMFSNQYSAAPQFDIKFLGSVPENTAATMKVGGKVTLYTDDNNERHEGLYEVRPGELDPTSDKLRYMTFIKTNLAWETDLSVKYDKGDQKPLLWEPINYLVYEVRIRNTSEVDDSGEVTPIDLVRHNLTVAYDGSSVGGVRRRDLMAYMLDESGNVVPVTTYDSDGNILTDLTDDIQKGGTFIGVPNKGGALIYNLDDLRQPGDSEEQLAQRIAQFWNTADLIYFSDIDDWGLEEIPYQNLGLSGRISFVDEGPIDTGQISTYLVAVPFTTNIAYSTSAGGTKTYATLPARNISTIFFGGRGLDGFQWSKDDQANNGQFMPVKATMSHQKQAFDEETQTWKNVGLGRIGYLSKYRLNNFKTQGNVYISGIQDGLEYGPRLTETLPTNWDLDSIEFHVGKSGAAMPPILIWTRMQRWPPGHKPWAIGLMPIMAYCNLK